MRKHGFVGGCLLLIACGGDPLPSSGSSPVGSSLALAFAPQSVDFGNHARHVPAPLIAITLTNDKPQVAVVHSVVMAGPDAADFRIDLKGFPLLFGLGPGASVSFDVSFTASRVGLEKAELTVFGSDPGMAMATVPLAGTGL